MDKTYTRFVVTVSASVEDINALSESVERLTQVMVDQISAICTTYNGKIVRVKFSELTEYDYSQSHAANVCPECGEPFDFCAMGHYDVAKAAARDANR